MSFKITNAADKISRALIELQASEPFFSYLLMHMKFTQTEDTGTMAVDANGNIWYSEKFVMSLNQEELKGLLCHEVLHIVLQHISRIGSRDTRLSNISQDVVVNALVLNTNMKLPEGGIPYNKYNDESIFNIGPIRIAIKDVSSRIWEDIYAEIYRQLPKTNCQGQGQGQGQSETETTTTDTDGKPCDTLDEHRHDEQDLTQEQVDKWKDVLVSAATYAQQL
jgi:predicted metal-dependent peptidase